ncbi:MULTISPECIES: glycosyltransferase [Streptomyces]|uniref:Glycosyltransferase family 1 protein n=1 Tax=Streptomyces griseocarneus TaxID=51201 RepID=A0ABX7RMW5_9ACTN|nr:MULTISPECIES: glycosyltransferase [Streptomyces]QSY48838.1 glycosyltransferase family 1 protein [Streptomyces griseocarneus]
MRVLIMTAGSRGDVAPYTGIGARLREAGHHVAVAAPGSFAGLVADSGLDFQGLPVDPRGRKPPADGSGGSGGAPSGTRELIRAAAAFVRDLGRGLADAAEAHDAQLLLLSTTTAPLGWHVAEAMGIPTLGAYLQPVAPTADFPPVVGGGRSLGRWGNRGAGRLALRVVDRVHAAAVKDLRDRLGLPPVPPRTVRRRLEQADWPVLHGFSPTLVPRPADWREGLRVVGNWWPHTDAGRRLPGAVEDFLRAGPPPVFVGFGSMGAGEGERLSELAVRALRRAGARGVVQAGSAGLSVATDDVLTVGDVPHALLFPRMAAVVHHAGAGTTAAALRAGVPAVPVPVTADQPFWARRVAALGAATGPVPFAELSADRLADAIRRALDEPSHRDRARSAATALKAQDGAGEVVRAIEDMARQGSRP